MSRPYARLLPPQRRAMAKYSRKYGRKLPKRRARRARKQYRVKRGMTKRAVKKLIKRDQQYLNTDTQEFTSWIYDKPVSTPVDWFAWAPGNPANTGGSMWARNQTDQFGEMSVGNYIRIKSWNIKCIISQESPIAPYATATNSTAGFIDVFFGKYRYENAPIDPLLTGFLQDGTLLVTPNGNKMEMMIPMNKNKHIVYWHKRFKVGTSAVSTVAYRFTIPCTKYILKNRKLYYGPTTALSPANLPIDSDATNLSVWATFHPAAGTIQTSPSVHLVGQWSMSCSTTATYHVAL